MKLKPFSISEIYIDEVGQRTLDINPLPSKHCDFDCVFCPFGRTLVKTDEALNFGETESFYNKLLLILKTENVDKVSIYPNGESLLNSRLFEIVTLIKKYGKKIKIISNGYLFNNSEFKPLLHLIDEIIGEIVITTEENFHKIQRPLKSYTLKKHILNMASFKKSFSGRFILDITILKGYSDSEEDILKLKSFVAQINPDDLYVQTPTTGKIGTVFAIDLGRVSDIEQILKDVLRKDNKNLLY